MEPIITTTANRIKQSGYWCEDADAMTNEFLGKLRKTWDDEIPIVWGLDKRSNLGISNALQALGAPKIRFYSRCNAILDNYANELFAYYKANADRVSIVVPGNGNIVTDNNRISARSMEYKRLAEVKKNVVEPHRLAIYNGLMILHTADRLFIRCIHATKELLGFAWMLDGEDDAAKLEKELKDYLREAINNG